MSTFTQRYDSLALILAFTSLALGCRGSDDVVVESESAIEQPESPSDEVRSRPNVVWILIDTLRRDHLGSYGYERNTSPHIDALAKNGVLFEQHFSQGPNTLESVPSYMTGKYFPVYLQNNYFFDIWFMKERPEDELLASEILGKNGYTTGMFSASPWFTSASRLGRSFDHFEPIITTNLQTTPDYREMNPGIYDWIEAQKDETFFAYIHTLDAHEPHLGFNTNTEWLDPNFPSERDVTLRFWRGGPYDEADQAHLRNLYDGGVSYADYTVRTIMDHLKALDILENTIVVISSDHGEILATDGITLGHPSTGIEDELFEVPLIMSGPGLPKGSRFGQRTENVDILPTLVDLLDLEHDAKFDGSSLVPLIEGVRISEIHPFVYSKAEHILFTAEPRHIIRDERTKQTFVEVVDDMTIKPLDQVIATAEAWQLPDVNGNRIAASTSSLDESYTYLSDSIAPGWIRYTSLPKELSGVFQTAHTDDFMKEQVVSEVVVDDNLWTRMVLGDPTTLSTSATYVAFNDTETAPRIANVRSVPPGTYTVSILARTVAIKGVQRATSFRVNIRNPEDFQSIRIEPKTPRMPTLEWREIGDIDLSGGVFYYHIEPGEKGDISAFGGFRFQDVNREAEPEHDIERISEELDALGYLN